MKSMNNQITTDVVKINWERMIQDTLNRRNWGKVFTLLRYNDTKITIAQRMIDLENSSITFVVRVTHLDEDGYIERDYNLVSVPFEKDHFNEVVFTKRLYRAGYQCLHTIATRILKKTNEYKKQSELDRHYRRSYYKEVDERVYNIMSKMPEMDGSITKVIKEALESHLRDNFEETNYAYDYLAEYYHKVSSLIQLSWAIITNQEPDVIDKCVEKSHKYHDLEIIESTVEEMEALLEELEEKALEKVEEIEVDMEDLI